MGLNQHDILFSCDFSQTLIIETTKRRLVLFRSINRQPPTSPLFIEELDIIHIDNRALGILFSPCLSGFRSLIPLLPFLSSFCHLTSLKYRTPGLFILNFSFSFLSTAKYGSEPCPVCTEKFALNDETRKLPCGHLYHDDCILPWYPSFFLLSIMERAFFSEFQKLCNFSDRPFSG